MSNNFAKSLLNKFVYTNKLEEKYNNDSLISDYDINIQITKGFYIKEENIVDSISSKEIVDTFKEYTKNEDNVKGFNEELNYKTTTGNTKKDFKMINKSLFYYDNISWDSGLELELYELFDKSLDSKNYLVIRNEVGFKMFNPFTKKQNDELIYSIEDKDIFELNGDGFEPDFIVLKKGLDNQIFQYFIEVKGEDKVDTKINKWKEHLLSDIDNEEVIIEDNMEYKICGLPFFTGDDIKNNSIKKSYIEKLK